MPRVPEIAFIPESSLGGAVSQPFLCQNLPKLERFWAKKQYNRLFQKS
jgi:hypothetical protein